MSGLLDFLQSASNSVASNVSGPVDLIGMLLRKAGVPVPQDSIGSSEWMKQQGLMRDVPQSAASLAGETFGLLSPVVAAAKAPQIARGLLAMGENAAAPRALNPQTGAIVWHGSPHKFDKFDSSKIGTGEGAQAYGHGLYLAESPGVAKSYQESTRPIRIKVGDAWVDATDDVAMVATSLDGAPSTQHVKDLFLKDAQRAQHLANTIGSPSVARSMLEKANAARRWASMVDDVAKQMGGRGIVEELGEGNLYKVDLPDSAIARMLDWDAPLSRQAPDVLQWAQRDDIRALHQMTNKGLSQATGADLYRNITSTLNQKKTGDLPSQMFQNNRLAGSVDAADALRQVGIPGIRYLDGGSRGAGSGTSNYVIFPGEESILKILERNGSPL